MMLYGFKLQIKCLWVRWALFSDCNFWYQLGNDRVQCYFFKKKIFHSSSSWLISEITS